MQKKRLCGFETTRAFNAHATTQLNIKMCVLDYIIKHTTVHVIYQVKEREKDACQLISLQR